MRKSIIKIIIAIMLLSTVFAIGCAKQAKAEIVFDSETIAVNVMQEKEVSVTVKNTKKTLEWSVGDDSILRVVPAEDGTSAIIVGLNAGNSSLIVKNEDAWASISVKVEKSSELYRLGVPETLSVLTGKEYALNPELIYTDKTLDAKFSYSSSDTNVATVSADGKIVAGVVGKTTINVVAEYLGFTFSKNVVVSVVPEIEIVSSTKEIEVYKKAEGSQYTSSQTFGVEVFADGVKLDVAELHFDTVDHEIAVIEEGAVVGISAGQTEISVTFTIAEQEYTDYIFVNVKELPQVEIHLSKENIVMYEYFREQALSAKVFIDGNETSEGSLTFTSADEEIATIENGLVKAKTNGKTAINVCYNDGIADYYTQAAVEVKNSVNKAADELGLEVNGVTVELKEDKALYFEDEIDLTGSTKETSFIKFHILSQNTVENNQTDVKHIFVKLTDVENPDNFVMYKINPSYTNTKLTHVKATSNTNGYFGWRWGNGDVTDVLDSDSISATNGEMGTRIPDISMYQTTADLKAAINLSFDPEENAAYSIEYRKIYLIFDLDTIVEHVSTKYQDYDLFDGFATNKVKLSVYASGYADNVDMVKLYIAEIKGTAAETYGIEKFKVK